MDSISNLPGPADVAYFTQAQAGAWGETLAAFARFVAPPPGGRVLDVGAGPGLLARLYADAGAGLALACDASWPMLRRAAELSGGRPALALLAAAALALPVADAGFDLVTATNLLFLLPDPAAGLAELARVTRPGGLVAFLNPGAAMSRASAEAFADARGLTGFARFSFINYGRLAEGAVRLEPEAWMGLAASAGLSDVQSQTRSGGLVVLVRGRKGLGST